MTQESSASNKALQQHSSFGKEVTKMKYAKPEITAIVCAEQMIRGGLKGGNSPDGGGAYVTSPAYEADE